MKNKKSLNANVSIIDNFNSSLINLKKKLKKYYSFV